MTFSVQVSIPRAVTDFNARDTFGRVMVARKEGWLGALMPMVGQRVVLEDADGNRCEGTVAYASRRVVHVHPDWSTWADKPMEVTQP